MLIIIFFTYIFYHVKDIGNMLFVISFDYFLAYFYLIDFIEGEE